MNEVTICEWVKYANIELRDDYEKRWQAPMEKWSKCNETKCQSRFAYKMQSILSLNALAQHIK